ncbi:hypothetical protein [Dongia sp.]|uniref:hypothetical protein n=1 Tax=Dongia sp. TaxID=1977262 RepID=UPI0035AE6787
MRRFLAIILGWVLLAPAGMAQSVEIDRPITVPLIKLEYPGNPPNIRMLYVKVLTLGQRAVNQPLLFDTGSVGVTIDCDVVLPAKLCSTEGIAVSRETEVNGITVTTRKIVARYGTYDEYGHLAFATLEFGSPLRPVKTDRPMPFLIRYKKVRRDTGEIVGGPLWPKGIFGISPVGSQADGHLKSVFDFLTFGAGVDRGYVVAPIGTQWRACTNEAADCPEVTSFEVGILDRVRSGFAARPMRASPSDHFWPLIDTCLTIDVDGTPNCLPTLFDTGNSTIVVGGDDRPPAAIGTLLTVDIPSVATWRITANYDPEIEFNATSDVHVIGIRYFEKNSLLIDLERDEVGFSLDLP